MCLTSNSIENAQIEKFVEHGMPLKVIKAAKYTLKKANASSSSSLSLNGGSNGTERRFLVATAATSLTTSLSSASLAVLSARTTLTASHSSPALNQLNNSTTTTTTTTTKTAAAATPTTTTKTTIEEAATATATTTTTTTQQETAVEEMNSKNELKIPKLCGRFRQMQENSNNNKVKSTTSDTEKVYVDALAVGTQLTKQFAQRLNRAAEKLQDTKIFTLLTRTTQPAHAIAICIMSSVLLTVWPDLVDQNKTEMNRKHSGSHHLAAIAYLGAFAIHFGAQIWMTFVSGLSLYFSLPRHTFGQCQQILFPKYFALNAMLSISMLILFVKYFLSSWHSVAGCVQLGALTVSAVIEVTVRLYLAPPMLRLMHEKYKIEGAIGSGQEVGSIDQGVLVQCPHYQRIHKSFRRIHMTVAMGNMTVLLATCLHLYFLASKIQIC